MAIMTRHCLTISTLYLACLCLTGVIWAQTTAFTYQGKLTDAGNPANGNHDLQFRLFDAAIDGAQVGSTVIREEVAVTGGIFTVSLDFGAAAFPGANRFLEISVRPGPNTGAFTALSPLQPISSTPYAVQSLNAANATSAINATNAVNFSGTLAGDVTGTQSITALANNAVTTAKLADGSVTDAKIATVAGSKVTGTIPIAGVPAGSTNYIQNTATLQAASNFNIGGNGFIGGKLGIGTTMPAQALQVNGAASLGAPGGVYGFSINNGVSPGPYPSRGFNSFWNGNVYLVGRIGVIGKSDLGNAVGVYGESQSSTGVGLYGRNFGGGYAGVFEGKVAINGVLQRPSEGFKIDHPLDPEKQIPHPLLRRIARYEESL